MKSYFKGIVAAFLLAFMLVPAINVSAAVQPPVPTGVGYYGQNKSEFGFSWDIDSNITLYGANSHFGYEVVVLSTKGKTLGTYDKNSIDNAYDRNFKADLSKNKMYMAIENSKLAKQAFKVKVRAYVFDEVGNKIYSDYTAEKVIVPRANIKSLKATSRSTGLIKWQKVKGAKSYTVYVSSNNGKKFKKQATVTGTSYTVKGMKLGKTYPVYVTANKIKIKKKKFSSTKPELKTSNASTIRIYLTY